MWYKCQNLPYFRKASTIHQARPRAKRSRECRSISGCCRDRGLARGRAAAEPTEGSEGLGGADCEGGGTLEPYGLSLAEIPTFDAMVTAYLPYIARMAVEDAVRKKRSERRKALEEANEKKRALQEEKRLEWQLQQAAAAEGRMTRGRETLLLLGVCIV